MSAGSVKQARGSSSFRFPFKCFIILKNRPLLSPASRSQVISHTLRVAEDLAMPPKSKFPLKPPKQTDALEPAEYQKPDARTFREASATSKRKKSGNSDEPQKAPRRSGRGASKVEPTRQQLLDYMLSEPAQDLCCPEEERDDIQSRGKIRTYTSVLNPFEELLCAVILSRPISHRLGLRSIRTVLNPPYEFTSAKAVKDAGTEKHVQAMYDARTQHKDKTAAQIGEIADVVLDKFTSDDDVQGVKMSKLLKDSDGDVDKALGVLKRDIKGLGTTGLNIFLRRVQCEWPAGYPFVDEKTSHSLRELGLPHEAEDLRVLLEEHWSKLHTKDIDGSDEAEKKRRAYTILLERATGAELEGKKDELARAAAVAATG